MAPVKSRTSPEDQDDAKSRLEQLLALLSPLSGRPWGYADLATWLRQEGFEIDDNTPKKWPQRGIPEKWARVLAERAARRGVIGVTAAWLLDGVGEEPRRVSIPPTGADAGQGPPSETDLFLWGTEAARRLLGTEAGEIPPGVKLTLLAITEADAVARFGPRAHAVADEIRREIRRRHGLPEPSDSTDP